MKTTRKIIIRFFLLYTYFFISDVLVAQDKIYMNGRMKLEVEKDEIQINTIDQRIYPLIIGEVPGIIRGTKIKIKDSKGKWFPAVTNIIKERLANEGFNENDANPIYNLEININNLFFKKIDKVVFIQIDQICLTEIKLIRFSDKRIVYSSDLSSRYSSKAVDVRKYVKSKGYNWREIGTIFLVVIDDMIKQLMEDVDFQNIIAE